MSPCPGRGTATAAAVLAAVLTLSGCGVQGESEARTVDDQDVPFELDQTTTPTTTTPPTTAAPATTVSPVTTLPPPTVPQDVVRLYFVRGSKLVEVEREVQAPADASSTLRVLLEGPPTDAAGSGNGSRGLRTALESDAVAGVSVEGGIADVDLRSEFVAGQLPGDIARAFAQLTLTLTGLPGIGQVTFRQGDTPLSVLRADGSVATQVSRDDFASLVAEPTGADDTP